MRNTAKTKNRKIRWHLDMMLISLRSTQSMTPVMTRAGMISGKYCASAKEFQGASGNITFNTEGDPLRSAQISTWEGKKIVSTYTVEPY